MKIFVFTTAKISVVYGVGNIVGGNHMSNEICGVIVCRLRDIIGDPLANENENYYGECIRQRPHYRPHVIKAPNGQYYAWEDDFACDCCKADEEDRCYLFWEVNEEKAREFLRGRE